MKLIHSNIIISAYLIFVFLISTLLNVSYVATYIAIPLTFLIFKIGDFYNNKNVGNKEYNILILFLLWSSFVSIFANNLDLAILTQRRLLIIVISIYPLISYIKFNSNNINFILLQLILYSIVISLSPLFLDAPQLDISYVDRDDLMLDANSYGYYTFFALMGIFLLYRNISGRIKIFLLILLVLYIPLAFKVQFTAASRGGFVVLIFAIFTGIISLNINDIKSIFKNLIMILIVFIIAIVITIQFTDSFVESYLYSRFILVETEDLNRQLHVIEATKVGLDNILLGVGGGNYSVQPRSFENDVFSHNGYLESFANYGLVGLILYSSLVLFYLNKIIRQYKKNKSDVGVLLAHFVFLVGFVIYNTLYVPYLTIEFMVTFFIFSSIFDARYRK